MKAGRLVVGVFFLLAYIVLLGLAVLLALWLAPPVRAINQGTSVGQEPWKGFASLAPIFVTVATAFETVLISLYTLHQQLAAARDLEKLRKVTEKSVPAFGELYAAASNYYRALAPLQTGDFDLAVIEEAESRMKSAEGASLFVADDYSDEWLSYWQSARYHKEYVSRNVHNPTDRASYWPKAAKDLAQGLGKMRGMAQRHFKS